MTTSWSAWAWGVHESAMKRSAIPKYDVHFFGGRRIKDERINAVFTKKMYVIYSPTGRKSDFSDAGGVAALGSALASLEAGRSPGGPSDGPT